MGIVPSIMMGLLNGVVLPAAAVASEAEAPLPPAAGERLADAVCPGSSGIADGGVQREAAKQRTSRRRNE